MNGWLLLARILVAWVALSIGGGGLIFAVLEFRFRWYERRDRAEMRAHRRAVAVTGHAEQQR